MQTLTSYEPSNPARTSGLKRNRHLLKAAKYTVLAMFAGSAINVGVLEGDDCGILHPLCPTTGVLDHFKPGSIFTAQKKNIGSFFMANFRCPACVLQRISSSGHGKGSKSSTFHEMMVPKKKSPCTTQTWCSMGTELSAAALTLPCLRAWH